MPYLMALAVTIAYFVKGMCGFANTLVFSTITGFATDNIDISPIDLLLGFPSNCLIAWRERRGIRLRAWLPLAILLVAGSVPGMFFLKNGDARVVKLLFGAAIAALGVEMLTREFQTKKHAPSKVVLAAIGVAAGLMSGLYGIGALLAAYFGRTSENTSAFKGNLCAVFVVDNVFRLTMYIFLGIVNASVALSALKLAPFMLLGLFLGIKSAGRVPEKYVKRAVIVLLILSGISLIALNL